VALPQVVYVCVGPGGIPNVPAAFLDVSPEKVANDRFRNRRLHGGPDQRLLLVATEDLAELRTLGFALSAGALGENIGTQGVDFRQLALGQRARIGEVKIEFTKLRIPCKTLDPLTCTYGKIQPLLHRRKIQAGDSLWGRGGIYARVLKAGRDRFH
jgi:MOSC domain-containing protein YiiM